MYLDLYGRKVHYETMGRGNPILLVHGWGGSAESLADLGRLLAKNRKVILLDLPGFGHSDLPGPDWGVEEYAKLITEFLAKLKIANVDYFGHSFGGSLGIYLALHDPSLVSKLILCDSSYKRSVTKPALLVRLARGIPKPVKKIIYRIFLRNSELFRYSHLEPNFRKIVVHDLSSYPEKIKAPTLILWGEEDRTTPLAWAKELNEKIKNSKLVTFPHIRHNLPLEYPDLVYKEIVKFL